jgi:hypothetical protein
MPVIFSQISAPKPAQPDYLEYRVITAIVVVAVLAGILMARRKR